MPNKNNILVTWEYWPEPVDGVQGDPIGGKQCVANLIDAVDLAYQLKLQYSSHLRYVDVTLHIIKSFSKN